MNESNVIDINKKKQDKNDNKSSAKYRNSQHFVQAFMQENKYSISADRFYYVDATGKKLKNYHMEFIRFWDNEKDRRNVNKSDCLVFLAGLKEEKRTQVWNEVVKKVTTYVPDNDEELNKLCNISIKQGDLSDQELANDREIFKITLKVWIQNLKSKLLRIDHRFPLIPVFWSYQGGTGKSALVEHLILPFQPFTHGATLEDISNSEKNYKIFTEKMIVYCEELAHASKANIEAIKDAVTRKTIQPRIFHTQDHDDLDCYSTMIFNSNMPITKIMNDPSNRRFVDINIKHEITDSELKSIKYLKLIQSIDIDRTPQAKQLTRTKVETFVIPFLASTKRKSPVEEFIEAACIEKNANSARNRDVNLLHIYNNFKNYYDFQKVQVFMSKDVFITELCNRVGVKEKRTKLIKRCISIDTDLYLKDAANEFRSF